MMLRLVIGAALAAIVAAAAARARLLSVTGAVAATVIGTAAVTAGWSWGIVLVVFFALTSALSAYGAERKRALTRGILAKGSTLRDATQVISNGEVFAAAGILWLATGDPLFLAAGGGAIAAAAADSWATEIGIALGGEPRSIISWTPMTRGTSGGVTIAGFAGAAAGAIAMAGTMLVIGWPRAVAVAALFAGMLGMIIDSVLGATLQARLFCPDCGTETEQPVHHCGRATQVIRGVRWMDNDLVNMLATLSGAVIAGILFVAGA
ncbi:MAG: DUF92 domain-containing protein [Gemmatimonadaceae bacterium]|nr:DUF92 domain-containing protein [Gemmatimonadaceae bacterium]